MTGLKLPKIGLIVFILMSLWACQGMITSNLTTEAQRSIPFKIIETGTQSGIQEKENFVILTKDKFEEFYKQHTGNIISPPAPPSIDFEKSTVLAVFSGVTTNVYKVEITLIDETSEKVIVQAKAYTSKSSMLSTEKTYPFCIVATEGKFQENKEVEFNITPYQKDTSSINEGNKKYISFETLEKGNYSCITEAKEVIKDEETWKSFYVKHISCSQTDSSQSLPQPPELNFTDKMVIALVIPNYMSDSKLEIQNIVEEESIIQVYAQIKPISVLKITNEESNSGNTNFVKIDKIYHLYHFVSLQIVDNKKVDFIVTYDSSYFSTPSPAVNYPTPYPTPSPYSTSVPEPVPTFTPIPLSYPDFETIEKGTNSYIREYKEVVIFNQEQFIDLWHKHKGIISDDVPIIDFEEYNVIGIFSGQQTGDYSIHIEQIAEHQIDTTDIILPSPYPVSSSNIYNQPSEIVVHVIEQYEGPNIDPAPYHLVKVAKFQDKPIRFDVKKITGYKIFP